MTNSSSTGALRADLGLLLLRVGAAAPLLFHGSQKLFGAFGGYGIEGTAQWMESIGIPFPTLSVIMAGSAELLGGVAFLTGLFARLMSLPVAFTMLVAGFTAHSGFDATQGGMEYPLLLAAVAGAIGLVGAGRIRLRIPALEPSASREASVA